MKIQLTGPSWPKDMLGRFYEASLSSGEPITFMCEQGMEWYVNDHGFEAEVVNDYSSTQERRDDLARKRANDAEVIQSAADAIDSTITNKVNPGHYSGDLVMQVIEERDLNFALASIVKYVARAGSKPGEDRLTDLRKAEWYLKREIDRLEAGR